MMKRVVLPIIMALSLATIANAQNYDPKYDKYPGMAREALEKGDLALAKLLYSAYTINTDKRDLKFEEELSKKMNNEVMIGKECFPDPLFCDYVFKNFDSDGDGKISQAEADAVTEINVYNYDNRKDKSKCIKSLKGIQYFTNLTTLSCGYNKIASLDVSKNPELKTLSCYGNQLTTLDVSKNTKLVVLLCNDNQLTTLDISKNKELTKLDCDWNQLTTLDVSKNTKLKHLRCSRNQLTTLDVSKNTKLETLSCSNNPLESLDASNNTKLTWLECISRQLKRVYVRRDTKFEKFGYNVKTERIYVD